MSPHSSLLETAPLTHAWVPHRGVLTAMGPRPADPYYSLNEAEKERYDYARTVQTHNVDREARLEIIGLRAAGLTRESAAKKLGIPPRTLARLQDEVAEELGATNLTNTVHMASAGDLIEPYTPRGTEQSIWEGANNLLWMLALGYTSKQVTEIRKIKMNTFHTHTRHIHRQIGSVSIPNAVWRAHGLGLLEPGAMPETFGPAGDESIWSPTTRKHQKLIAGVFGDQ